jgi:hypothetical protein
MKNAEIGGGVSFTPDPSLAQHAPPWMRKVTRIAELLNGDLRAGQRGERDGRLHAQKILARIQKFLQDRSMQLQLLLQFPQAASRPSSAPPKSVSLTDERVEDQLRIGEMAEVLLRIGAVQLGEQGGAPARITLDPALSENPPPWIRDFLRITQSINQDLCQGTIRDRESHLHLVERPLRLQDLRTLNGLLRLLSAKRIQLHVTFGGSQEAPTDKEPRTEQHGQG